MDSPLPLSLERRLHAGGKIAPPEDFREALKNFLLSQVEEKNEAWFLQFLKDLPEAENLFDLKVRLRERLALTLEAATPAVTPSAIFSVLRTRAFRSATAVIFLLFLGGWGLVRFLLGGTVESAAVTSLQNLSGEAGVISSGATEQIPAAEGILLGAGDSLLTDPGATATIKFFDDTLVLLDENSHLTILESTPNPAFPTTGIIQLHLEQGQAWVRNFALPTEDSSFTLQSGDILITPLAGAFDVERSSAVTTVRIWDRSVRLSDRIAGRNTLFIAGDKAAFTALKPRTLAEISAGDRTTAFLQEATVADAAYRRERYENVLAEYRQTVGVLPDSFWHPLKRTLQEQIAGTAQPRQLDILTERFREAVLLAAEQNYELAEQVFLESTREAKALLQQYPETELFITHIFYALQKLLTALPENSPLIPLAPTVFSAAAEVFQFSPVLVHRNLIEPLWEMQEAILAGKLATQDQLIEYTAQKELLPNPVAAGPEERRALLALKIQELELLDFLFSRIFAAREIRQNEVKTIAEILSLAENQPEVSALLWDDTRYLPEENPVTLFRTDIETYTTVQGRQNQTLRRLEEIENIARNLPLLQEIRSQLDRDLRALVTDKMIAIVELEEQRAILEAN